MSIDLFGEHWLVVTVPAKVTTDHAFLMIGGAAITVKTPDGADVVTSTIARTTGSIVAELKNVPNQPLVFHQDGTPRTEDEQIVLLLVAVLGDRRCRNGYHDCPWSSECSTRHGLHHREFAASEAGGKHAVSKIVVGGGSKRGWTTWMTGVADQRVAAVVRTIVIDDGQCGASLRHHVEAYGFWAEAIGNYYQHKNMQRFDHPRLKELYRIVDPYYNLERLDEPNSSSTPVATSSFCPTHRGSTSIN